MCREQSTTKDIGESILETEMQSVGSKEQGSSSRRMGESRRACWSGADAVGKEPSGGLRDLAVGFGPLGVTTVTGMHAILSERVACDLLWRIVL